MNKSRRSFVIGAMTSGAVIISTRASAQTPAAVLSETDPQAVALGYRADAGKVDKAKYPQHQAGQVCSGCNFYQGKAADAQAPCQLFGGKQVAGKGWCSAYAKKTG